MGVFKVLEATKVMAESNSNEQNAKIRKFVRISFRVEDDPDPVVTINYLLGRANEGVSKREGRRRGIDAFTTFWKPYAWRAKKGRKPEDLQAIARDSIEQLLRHIQRIAIDFDVDMSLGGFGYVSSLSAGIAAEPTPSRSRSKRQKAETPPQEEKPILAGAWLGNPDDMTHVNTGNSVNTEDPKDIFVGSDFLASIF